MRCTGSSLMFSAPGRSTPTTYSSSNETRAAISANPSRQLYGNGRLLADLELRDLVSMHFVRAIGKPKGTGMRIGMGKAKVLRHAGPAVGLDGPVDHVAGNVGRMHFDHGDLFAGSFVAGDVHFPRRAQHHVAGSINHDPRVRNALSCYPVIRDRTAKCHPLGGPPAHLLQRNLRLPDQAHAVVNAPRPKPPLSDLEAASFPEQHIRRRHSHIIELDLHMAVRCIVISEHGQMGTTFSPFASAGTNTIDCWRCLEGLSRSVFPITM